MKTSRKITKKKAARPAAKRVRRSAEEAHDQILDAADKRLAASGPQGIRLQEIAADVGVSHPTILHHFGSREALVEAVVDRALDTVRRDVVAAFTKEPLDHAQSSDLIRRIMTTLGDRGHARLMAWLALEGRTQEDKAHLLRAVAEVMHARRHDETKRDMPQEDTTFVVLLCALVFFAEGVLGDAMLDSAGLSGDPGARERFHAWLVALLERHMHRTD